MREDGGILAAAMAHYGLSAGLPWPPEFACSEGWGANQRKARLYIERCEGALAAVRWAQEHVNSGFNHRVPVSGEVERQGREKLGHLNVAFPGLDFAGNPFCESPLSRPETLFALDGKTVSNIHFWHLQAYLACTTWLCGAPRSIVELGPGLGELARIFLMTDPTVRYVLVDSPEALFFAEVYLALNLPHLAIGHAANGDTGGVLLLPVPMVREFRGNGFDLAVNQGSMQEMPPDTVRAWLAWMDARGAKTFYSLNYDSTPLLFPPGWELVRETRRPPAIVLDCTVDRESCWRRL